MKSAKNRWGPPVLNSYQICFYHQNSKIDDFIQKNIPPIDDFIQKKHTPTQKGPFWGRGGVNFMCL